MSAIGNQYPKAFRAHRDRRRQSRRSAAGDENIGFVQFYSLQHSTKDGALRQAQRFRPEDARRVHQLDYIRGRTYKFIDLPVFDDQRWSRLEHHEIVPADLCEHSLVPEQPHHQRLTEHAGMNLRKSFEGNAQTQWSPAL